MTERTRQTTVFKNWYDRNRQAFNAKRRARYKQDPEVRAKAQEAADQYRGRMRSGEPEEPQKRDGLWTTTGVAYQLGISTQTLRNWEARGVIPVATFGVKHRLYSTHQVQLLEMLYQCMTAHHAAMSTSEAAWDEHCKTAIAAVFDGWTAA